MEVYEEKKGKILILHLKGRIVNFCSDLLDDELNTIINTGCFNTIINLENVNYLSASCLRAFLRANKRSKRFKGEVCLCKPSQPAMELIEFTKVNKILRVFKETKEAEIGLT